MHWGVEGCTKMIKLKGKELKTYLKILGKLIHYYRTKKGLLIKQLAIKVGVDQSTVCRWQSGTYKPSGDSIIGLIIHADFDVKLAYAIQQSMPGIEKLLKKKIGHEELSRRTQLTAEQAEQLLKILGKEQN